MSINQYIYIYIFQQSQQYGNPGSNHVPLSLLKRSTSKKDLLGMGFSVYPVSMYQSSIFSTKRTHKWHLFCITSSILWGARADTTPNHIWTLVERVTNRWVTLEKGCLDVQRGFDKWFSWLETSDLKTDQTRMATFSEVCFYPHGHMAGSKHHDKEKNNICFSRFARFCYISRLDKSRK